MATFAETARTWALQQGSPNNLREAVRNRLLDPDPPRVGYGRVDEFPEDVVVELLTNEQLSLQEKAVASGWDAALSEVQRSLRDPLVEEAELRRLQCPFTRVFRVAELTGHPFLREGVRSTLPLATSESARITSGQVQEVVAAALAYAPEDADRGGWERLLEKRAEVAGFAFRMLLRLDPRSSKISDYIQGLFQREFRDGWNLDAWFLAEYVISATGSDEPIVGALLRIASDEPTLWEKIATLSKANPCCSRATLTKVERRLSERPTRPRFLQAYRKLAEGPRDLIEVESSELSSMTLRGRRRRVLSEDFEGESIELFYARTDVSTGQVVTDAIEELLCSLEKKVELRTKLPANLKGATHG